MPKVTPSAAAAISPHPHRTAARKRDPARSRARILETATRHFVEKGYDGARIDEIVADSQVSKNLVYHYFGSKEALFVAVLERIYEKFRDRRGDLRLPELPPIEGLRKLACDTFDALAEMPEIVSLLNTENLLKAVHIHKSKRIRPIYDPLLREIGALLRRGEAAGVFRSGIEPIQLYVTMAALGYHYIANRYTYSAIFGFDLAAPRRLRSRREHAMEVVLRYCIHPSRIALAGLSD
jgi:TetR/AcrR family transcriptional regulator